MASVVCFLIVTGLCVVASQGFAAVPTNSKNVPISINHDKGSFKGQLQVTVKGSLRKASVQWKGSIRNTSSHKVHRADFCLKAFDSDDTPIQVGGEPCILRLWGNSWETGALLNFKGKQKIQISPQSKEIVRVSRYEISATEVFDHAPNLRHIEARCPLVWTSAIRAFADKKFHPKMMDKDSFTGNFEFAGGRVDGATASKRMLKAFTTANTRLFGPQWDAFRIDKRFDLFERR